MRDQLMLLFELQKIDSEIHLRTEKLKQIPEPANASRTLLDAAEKEWHLAQDRQETANRDRRRLELELAGEKEKLRKWEARLNDIRNSREAAALGRETEALKRQNRETEEKIIALIQEFEDAQRSVKELGEKVQTERADFLNLDAETRAECNSIEAEVGELSSRRTSIIEQVQVPLYKNYAQLLEYRHGLGLVLVKGGTCMGCHMQLPPQLYNELQRGNTVENCPTCRRILFWEPLSHSDEENSANA